MADHKKFYTFVNIFPNTHFVHTFMETRYIFIHSNLTRTFHICTNTYKHTSNPYSLKEVSLGLLLTKYVLLGAYRYGYDIGTTGNFHHELRGPDGVTYGCFGYIDPNHILRVTHYVADSHGFRHVTPERPVEVFSDLGLDSDNPRLRKEQSGRLVALDDLYFPVGCGSFEGGAKRDSPVLPSQLVSILNRSNLILV